MLQSLFQWLHELHSAAGISHLIENGGLFVITAIVFSETGLLVGFFLPGDSLLITAGVLSNPANINHIATLDIVSLNLCLVAATILGDQVGYAIGKKTGDRIWSKPDGRFYKKKHLESAHEFYARHGGISLVGAKYVPIFRTFVPFAAGLARMPYRRFLPWNILGGALWATSVLWIGYFLGQTELANRLDKVILLVIAVSLLPMAIGLIRRRFRRPVQF